MVTYLELGGEPVWRAQTTPPNMTDILVKPLRLFYGVGAALIGAPGDNNHLRGRHRSRNWDLTSQYCTNRTYATTDARDKAGDGDHYRAIDVGITGQKLYAASRRMDQLVRSGGDGGRVAEWFGTFDGATVVGWFEGHPSSSDVSHLYHLHVGVWTKWADDAGLMRLLYETITGDDMTPEQALSLKRVENYVFYNVLALVDPIAIPGSVDTVPNVLAKTLRGIAASAGMSDEEFDALVAATREAAFAGAQAGDDGPTAQEIADAVLDEEHARLAE